MQRKALCILVKVFYGEAQTIRKNDSAQNAFLQSAESGIHRAQVIAKVGGLASMPRDSALPPRKTLGRSRSEQLADQ